MRMKDYVHKGIYFGSTVVVATNRSELMYLLEWAEEKSMSISDYMWSRYKFPYCLSFSDKIVGWTDQMDRNLYYKSFDEFLKDIKT